MSFKRNAGYTLEGAGWLTALWLGVRYAIFAPSAARYDARYEAENVAFQTAPPATTRNEEWKHFVRRADSVAVFDTVAPRLPDQFNRILSAEDVTRLQQVVAAKGAQVLVGQHGYVVVLLGTRPEAQVEDILETLKRTGFENRYEPGHAGKRNIRRRAAFLRIAAPGLVIAVSGALVYGGRRLRKG